MPVRWAIASGNWSTGSTWNDFASLGFPTVTDEVWANSFNVNIDQSFEVEGLRNNVRARDIATPQMTANNAPSPYVAAVSSLATGNAFNVFDRNLSGTTWRAAFNNGWVSMDFGSGSSIIIDGYTIYGSGVQTENPRNWTFESSNDNINWTIRHTVTLPSAIAASSTYSVASISNTTGS